jgi:structural protein KPP10_ORF10
MGVYSFLDVQASISGPGGTFSLGSDAGAAEEGITTAFVGEKNTMTKGAGGDGMHSLHASNAGKITLRYLKTSPVNSQLSAMYNFQKSSSGNWGQNVIKVSNVVRGDVVDGQQCAFTKHPDLTYAVEGGTIEWEFDVIQLDELIGAGVPDVNI